MTLEEPKVLKVGEKVPDFELNVYLPDKQDFGKVKFSDIFKKGNWLVLFFYPADYTFVCPAKWRPGKRTLTPGKDLVGRVGDKLLVA